MCPLLYLESWPSSRLSGGMPPCVPRDGRAFFSRRTLIELADISAILGSLDIVPAA
jgi:hypothetical protein